MAGAGDKLHFIEFGVTWGGDGAFSCWVAALKAIKVKKVRKASALKDLKS